jgi:PAT family beta-lactamase induction signal transducer AmpG
VLNVPHLTYFYLSQALPENAVWIGAVVALEKFGFGMGSVGQMLYMMQQVAPGPFRMTHYAMATGVMALTKWSTGTVSGWVWGVVGHDYGAFFALVLAFSVPPILLAWRAPFPHPQAR